MTAAELDELERLLAKATPEARANARLVAAMRSALPALIAKVRAAEELAGVVDDYGGRCIPEIGAAWYAYRKTGQP